MARADGRGRAAAVARDCWPRLARHGKRPANGRADRRCESHLLRSARALGYLWASCGHYPVFLAKFTLFGHGFVARVIRGTGQIPVNRDARLPPAAALKPAEDALAAGQCVVVYPEGTCTRDPDLWPMTGQTARRGWRSRPGRRESFRWRHGERMSCCLVARARRAALPELSSKPGFHPSPRKTMKVIAGPPVDLGAYQGQPLNTATLRAATADIMHTIARLVGELRGESAPAELYDHPQGD